MLLFRTFIKSQWRNILLFKTLFVNWFIIYPTKCTNISLWGYDWSYRHTICLRMCPAVDRLSYTQRNLFEILLNQPEIILYLPFSDWFRTKRISVWFQIKKRMVRTHWKKLTKTDTFRQVIGIAVNWHI